MSRYLRLLFVQIRTSLATAMHYRVDFLVQGVISLWWVVWTLVPLLVVFGGRSSIAGWSMPEALMVVAWFTLLRGILEGAINPSLLTIVEHIRLGTLDFVLVKPADAQFLVSTAKFVPWKLLDVVAAGILMFIAFARLGRSPEPTHVALAGVMLIAAVAVMYSLWILVVSAAFWVVRLDNLAYLFSSIFDAARWPLSVFRGVWKFLFTFVIPLGLMTTFPAMALLGTLSPKTAFASLGGALALAVLARLIWTAALARYTSASS